MERLPGERVLAAPSWVFPGSIEENCFFLDGRVDEAGLLFMESTACLAYDEQDLPPSLASLRLSYHVHLPADLPMDQPAHAARVCADLLDKTTRLIGGPFPTQRFRGALRAVLHPPCHDPANPALAGRYLAEFAENWLAAGNSPSTLLLENTRDNDLTELSGPVQEYGFALCLDTGHCLAYGQERLARCEGLLQHVGMLHVNAPGKEDCPSAHLPLDSLDAEGRGKVERLCNSVPPQAVIMLELFSWQDILASLPLLRSWLTP